MQTNQKFQQEEKIEVISKRALLTKNIVINKPQEDDEMVEVNTDMNQGKKNNFNPKGSQVLIREKILTHKPINMLTRPLKPKIQMTNFLMR